MRRSAFVHLVERLYNRLEHVLYRSREVARRVLDQFLRLARRYDVEVVVVGLRNDPATAGMLRYVQDQGIMTTDLSVNLNRKGYQVLSHPGALATPLYAEKLEVFLTESILR